MTDPAGASVGSAVMEAANVDTKAKYRAASTSTGNYAFPELPSGNYVITVSASGFMPYVSETISVTTGQTTRWDILLAAEKEQ